MRIFLSLVVVAVILSSSLTAQRVRRKAVERAEAQGAPVYVVNVLHFDFWETSQDYGDTYFRPYRSVRRGNVAVLAEDTSLGEVQPGDNRSWKFNGVSRVTTPTTEGIRTSTWFGGERFEFHLQKGPEGIVIVGDVYDNDVRRQVPPEMRAITKNRNVHFVTRNDALVTRHHSSYANASIVIFDVTGEADGTWNLEPLGEESSPEQLLRYLLLRYDDRPKSFAAPLLSLGRLMPLVTEIPDREIIPFLDGLRKNVGNAMPAERLKLALEQTALMSGVESAVPTTPDAWTDPGPLTELEWIVYAKLAHVHTLSKGIRSYAATRTLAAGKDSNTRNYFLSEIDQGRIPFDEARAPGFLARFREEIRHRDPTILTALSGFVAAVTLVAVIFAKRLTNRLLLG